MRTHKVCCPRNSGGVAFLVSIFTSRPHPPLRLEKEKEKLFVHFASDHQCPVFALLCLCSFNMSYHSYTNGRNFTSPPGSLNGADSPSLQAVSLAMRGALRVLPASPRSPRDSDSDSWRGSRENFFASVMSLRGQICVQPCVLWLISRRPSLSSNCSFCELLAPH